MPCVQTPARFINQGLGMLNAKANGKGLGFQGDSSLLKHVEAVSSGMPWSQHHLTAGQCSPIRQRQANHL